MFLSYAKKCKKRDKTLKKEFKNDICYDISDERE